MHHSVRRAGIAFVVAMVVRAAPLLAQQQRVATAALSAADSNVVFYTFVRSESGWSAAGKRTVAFDDLTCARKGLR